MKALEEVLHELNSLRLKAIGGAVLDAGDFADVMNAMTRADLKKGEPLFVIRGQDAAGPDGVHQYREVAAFRGATLTLQQSVDERERDFREWQRLNPDLVKIPD